MGKPFTNKGILLTPKTHHVALKVESKWSGLDFTGNIGSNTVSFTLSKKECRHLGEFFLHMGDEGKKKP